MGATVLRLKSSRVLHRSNSSGNGLEPPSARAAL